MAPRRLFLAKHGFPVLNPAAPAREWALSPRGESEALLLADRLRPHAPFHLVSSAEPKARRTAEIMAGELCMPFRAVAALREIDRPALPIVRPSAHRELNRPVFLEPDRAMLGSESATAALNRFSAAIQQEVDRCAPADIVAVSHGTVIALFVAKHNSVDGFQFWCGFECGEFVTLAVPSFELIGSRG